MIVTFPHMGNIYVLVKTLFDEVGIDYIIPPKCSKKTLEIGTKYSPEMACLPLKINIGNFIESIEKGADTVIITGACGPCRFGYYAELHREILKDLGYDVEVIALEINEKGIGELLEKIRKLIGEKSLSCLIRPLIKAYKALKMTDHLDEISFKIRPREKIKGATDKVMNKLHDEMGKVKGYKEVSSLLQHIKHELEEIPIDNSFETVKIGIVGEIYTLIEPFTNVNVEKILGNMGIEVERSLYISEWIAEHIIKQPLHLQGKKEFEKEARPFLKTWIGGHALETVGNSAIYGKRGYDGIIQIYPLTCMPEIVADSILPSVCNKYKIPSLTLIMDEITGEAGYITRIDAFADMLKRRREIKEAGNEVVLSGN